MIRLQQNPEEEKKGAERPPVSCMLGVVLLALFVAPWLVAWWFQYINWVFEYVF